VVLRFELLLLNHTTSHGVSGSLLPLVPQFFFPFQQNQIDFSKIFTIFEVYPQYRSEGKMAMKIITWLNKKYPQNILIKNPLIGSIIFLVSCVCFILIYKPFQLHASRYFNYEMTVAIYFTIVGITLFGFVRLLKCIRFFSDPNDWTIMKELFSIVISLLCMGLTIYFSGFIMENPGNRWNLSTFFNSLIIASLIGIIPLLFFTIINYRYMFVTDILKNFSTEMNSLTYEKSEELVRIGSQLKKEELEFYPGQFIYAESDGNYIVFHLNIDSHVRKRVIRNSISNIEQQLSVIPFFFRTHRAFIINVKKVSSQKGNTLGYRLKLTGIDTEIPVSRQKAHDFNEIMKRYH
jgi:hypothetical protein